MKVFASALIAASAFAQAASNHWAVIVAGSNGYWNYRHQADAHHAWQVITDNGIPESNIILFAYDDIANNASNPIPGSIFNKPDGSNVYNSEAIDYRGASVTPENFIAALTGEPTTGGNGKVLQSDSSSKVFVFFTDHGAPGLIAFPSSYLYADTLNTAVNVMQSKGMYDQLIFYIEACESGSMFPQLSANIGVAAMTASDATQSSWATYCPPMDVVGGVHIGSCLGDLFSVNWIEDTEAHNPAFETLLEQHANVKAMTTMSPVELFGELDFGNEYVGDFQGVEEGASPSKSIRDTLKKIPYADKTMSYLNRFQNAVNEIKQPAKTSNVNSRDAKLHYLFNIVQNGGGVDAHQALKDEIDHRMFIDKLFAETFPKHFGENANELELTVQPEDFECLRFLMEVVENNCGRFSDYSLKYVKHLVHVCENQAGQQVLEAGIRISDFCIENEEALSLLQ